MKRLGHILGDRVHGIDVVDRLPAAAHLGDARSDGDVFGGQVARLLIVDREFERQLFERRIADRDDVVGLELRLARGFLHIGVEADALPR